MAAKQPTAPSDAVKQIHYLAAALKAPRITEAAARLADQARDAGWTHEDYLAAVLEREVSARNASGAAATHPLRPGSRHARPSTTSTGTTSPPSVNKSPRSPPGRSSPRPATSCCSAHPAPAKPTSPQGSASVAAHHGHRVLFATAVDWVARLQDAHRLGRLPAELARLRRYGLIIIDEVGYLPFEQDAANLVFQLVSSRYEHASLILTSNLPFSSWGGVFGDQAVAAAMIDRIVHHADVLTLKGASYRLRNRGIDTLPSIRAGIDQPDDVSSPSNYTAHFSTGNTAQFSTVIDSTPSHRRHCRLAVPRHAETFAGRKGAGAFGLGIDRERMQRPSGATTSVGARRRVGLCRRLLIERAGEHRRHRRCVCRGRALVHGSIGRSIRTAAGLRRSAR